MCAELSNSCIQVLPLGVKASARATYTTPNLLLIERKIREALRLNFQPLCSRIPDLNLVPRVLWLFGQRVGASRDSGVLEFSYRKISAVKQWKSLQGSQSKKIFFQKFSRVSTGAHPLTKKPEDSGYENDPT